MPLGAPPSKAGVPQATQQLQKKPPVSTSTAPKSVSSSAAIVPATTVVQESGDIPVWMGAAALVLSLVALAVQVWFLL